MNKKAFSEELQKVCNKSEEECKIVMKILENHFIFSLKEKEKIIRELEEQLQWTSLEATKVYETALNIIKREVKTKLKHPFRNQSK